MSAAIGLVLIGVALAAVFYVALVSALAARAQVWSVEDQQRMETQWRRMVADYERWQREQAIAKKP